MNTITLGAIIIGYIFLRRLVVSLVRSTTPHHLSSAEHAENYGLVAQRSGSLFGAGRSFLRNVPMAGLTP